MIASKFRCIVLVFAALALSTCGGGGGGGGGGTDDPAQFRVVELRPMDGENFVSQYVRPRVRFSHNLNPATLLGGISLMSPTGPVDGALYIDANYRTITFDPAVKLDLATTYTLILASSIANADGLDLRKDRSFVFTTVTSPTIRQLEARDFRPTWGPLNVGRSQHTATLLLDGTVLLTGGFTDYSHTTGSAEIYLPDEFIFTGTANSMMNARARHTATLLADGRVLVVGGLGNGGNDALATCDLFDPVTHAFSTTGSLAHARAYHTSERLDDGRVVVFGGAYFDHTQSSVRLDVAEIYDPATGKWSEIQSPMIRGRSYHTSTRLEDDTYLIVGGGPDWAAEIFDPATLTFTRTPGDMQEWRGGHTAQRLQTGLVLLSGGGAMIGEVYDPTAGTFVRTSNGLSIDRTFATVTPIRDGGFLILGGVWYGSTETMLLATMDIFAPIQGPYGRYFQIIYTLHDNRAGHTATRLLDESVLVTGGINIDWMLPELKTAFRLVLDD
jgi:Bacterial Ig-like domain/Galactose oxidase, central domain